jgi:hypothetical protein
LKMSPRAKMIRATYRLMVNAMGLVSFCKY